MCGHFSSQKGKEGKAEYKEGGVEWMNDVALTSIAEAKTRGNGRQKMRME